MAVLLTACISTQAKTLRFSGLDWIVRSDSRGGPGPNNWAADNASVDAGGALHLKLTNRNGKWYCPEVYTKERLGYGRYQFWIVGRVDKLDPNVVLGLFNYPTSDVGPDGTHEIDIEFAQWGNPDSEHGNYTVWPAKAGLKPSGRSFAFDLGDGDYSTQRFIWSPNSISFQSLNGHYDDDQNLFADWLFQPKAPAKLISRHAMPVHINLWCFRGNPPLDGKPVEIVVSSFKFTPG